MDERPVTEGGRFRSPQRDLDPLRRLTAPPALVVDSLGLEHAGLESSNFEYVTELDDLSDRVAEATVELGRAASAPGQARPSNRSLREGWDSRHHLLFSRENHRYPLGQRDYFDRPRDLRLVQRPGEDGIAEPLKRRPSMRWLRHPASRSSQRSSVSRGSQASNRRSGSWSGTWAGSTRSQLQSRGSSRRSLQASRGSDELRSPSPSLQHWSRWAVDEEEERAEQKRQEDLADRARAAHGRICGYDPHDAPQALDEPRRKQPPEGTHVGSLAGSVTKPRWQQSASWICGIEKAQVKNPFSVFRPPPLNQPQALYSEQHGTMVMHPKAASKGKVPWNNRWHMNMSSMNDQLHDHHRSYFDKPSNLDRCASEDWRELLADGCKFQADRPAGLREPIAALD